MQPQTANEPDAFRHLFILNTPSHNPNNRSQNVGLQLASTLRHRIEAYPNAPHGYYVVDDDRAEDELEILAFFHGNDILKELENLRQARRMEQMNILDEGQNVTEQKAPISTIPHPGPRIRYPSGSPRDRATSHAQKLSSDQPSLTTTDTPPTQTPPTTLSPTASLSRSAAGLPPVTSTDRNTLMPLSRAREAVDDASGTRGALYTMEMKFDPAVEPSASGQVFVLPIDTAAPTLWFFQKDCKRLLKLWRPRTNDNRSDPSEDDWRLDDWFPYANELRLLSSKKTLSPGDENARVHGYISYTDGGAAWLHRYDRGNEVMALIPSWNWQAQLKAETVLPLPRVLAYGVNDELAKQPFHGNLGIAMPGWTTPFDQSHPSTFFEAIKKEQHVDKPTRITLRLLHPEVVSGLCPDDVRSYLYYGDYWPCYIYGLGDMPGQVYVPTFTPRIRVLPTALAQMRTSNRAISDVKVFRWWTVPLRSISLLVPKKHRVNRSTAVPWRDMEEWDKHTIVMPDVALDKTSALAGNPAGPHTGIPVILDTCSEYSFLPEAVCKRIAIEWLGMTTPDPHPGDSSAELSEPSNPDWDSYSGEDETAAEDSEGPMMNIYCPDSLDLDDHDILFTFEGEDGNPVDFRCTASRFLSSVWREPEDRGTQVLIRGKAVTAGEDAKWVLGQNFFWTAFVRLDCSFTGFQPVAGEGTHVNVRLAPQRSKDAAGNVAEETSIRLHKLPGRIQELATAGLKYED
ncbi:hypothetical protein VTO73DRAFT_12646 [Trametes versicolor]